MDRNFVFLLVPFRLLMLGCSYLWSPVEIRIRLWNGIEAEPTKPNIICSFAANLSYGELGVSRQVKIETKHIERISEFERERLENKQMEAS